MSKAFAPRACSARGASIVELAVALPVIVLLVIGAADFARVFYMAIELQNAARAGAQYGAANSGASTTTLETTAQGAAVNLHSVSAFASKWCVCGTDSAPGTTIVSCTSSCAGGHLVTSVTVTAASTFSLISFYPMPGIPHTFSIRRSATLRVE